VSVVLRTSRAAQSCVSYCMRMQREIASVMKRPNVQTSKRQHSGARALAYGVFAGFVATCVGMSGVAYGDDGDAASRTVTVFDRVALEYGEEQTQPRQRGPYVIRQFGQIAERRIVLPPMPRDMRDAQRIVATVTVEPRLEEHQDGRFRPGDPWPRLGGIYVLLPGAEPGAVDDEGYDAQKKAEIMRFVTGFGGPGTFTQDITPLAPLLAGEQTVQVYVSTYMSPGWDVSVTLTYSSQGVGPRRPVFASPVFQEQAVTASNNMLRAKVNIPPGLDRPRMRIVSTGHATDGAGGDEFITRTHVLRIDGQEIARFRPWLERGGILREANPMSGRERIDGRELWSSDLDRSGWAPGHVVWPDIIPVPELTPGEHEIELEIQGIRAADPAEENGDFGYWSVSVIVIADEPWPRP
jgi:hypothetical protein